MSYTFSRRDFMKYSAVAAVAVAGSSMFTGCGSFSNPNRPSTTYDPVNGSELSFGGKSGGILGFGGTQDYLVLKKGASYTSGTSGTLKLEFTHYPISQGTSAIASCYQLKYVTEDGNHYVTSANGVASDGGKGLETNKETQVKVIVTIPADVTAAVEKAKAVYIQYFPRNNALGREDDTFSDVYATWDITSLIVTD